MQNDSFGGLKKKGRYAYQRARREWNSLAKPGHKITTKSGYIALKEQCILRAGETCNRRIEMHWYESKDGVTHQIEF